MVDVYAQIQDIRSITANGGNVTKGWTCSLHALDGTSPGNVDVQVTLPFDAPQHKWTQAATNAAVEGAAQLDVESVGGYRVLFVYLLDLTSIKP